MSIVTAIAPAHVPLLHNTGYFTYNDYNLPFNDSIALTLDSNTIYAKATVIASKEFMENRLIINGREEDIMKNLGLYRLVDSIKKRSDRDLQGECWSIKARTETNIPDDLRLDSKAAEYAAFATALAKIYEVSSDISDAARMAYGPSCLSMYGGIVKWYKSTTELTSLDSCSKPILDSRHWPNLRILALAVTDEKKTRYKEIADYPRSSEYAMQKFQSQIPMTSIEFYEAAYSREFSTFAEIAMKESDLMHATFMLTYPPVNYLNDVSRGVAELVHEYNRVLGYPAIGYTFGTNPNPTLFMMEMDVRPFLSLLNHYYPPSLYSVLNGNYLRGLANVHDEPDPQFSREINHQQQTPGKIKYIIHACLSDGPRVVSDL